MWVEGIQRIVCGVTDKTTCQVRPLCQTILRGDWMVTFTKYSECGFCQKPFSLYFDGSEDYSAFDTSWGRKAGSCSMEMERPAGLS